MSKASEDRVREAALQLVAHINHNIVAPLTADVERLKGECERLRDPTDYTAGDNPWKGIAAGFKELAEKAERDLAAVLGDLERTRDNFVGMTERRDEWKARAEAAARTLRGARHLADRQDLTTHQRWAALKEYLDARHAREQERGETMRQRRHHNNDGLAQIRRGKTRKQVTHMAKRLGISEPEKVVGADVVGAANPGKSGEPYTSATSSPSVTEAGASKKPYCYTHDRIGCDCKSTPQRAGLRIGHHHACIYWHDPTRCDCARDLVKALVEAARLVHAKMFFTLECPFCHELNPNGHAEGCAMGLLTTRVRALAALTREGE